MQAVRPLSDAEPGGYGRGMRSCLPEPATAAAATHAAAAATVAGGVPGPTAGVRIRRIRSGDHDRLQQFYAGLSDESRQTRFLGPATGIGDRQSTYFCSPDHAHREGFVAIIDAATRPAQIVGHICVEPDGPASAEVAVAVADAFQARGIGRRLVDAAVLWAQRDGFRTLTATMLAGNPAIQRLLTGLGLPSVAMAAGAGIIEVRIDLGDVRSAA